MSIEGLGKRFQKAREARGLTLDEAARLTKIRPSRLAEIEADDFSQFPSLAYAKGFLLIYGKFLDVDVSEYLDAFETSSQVTVDGYSYLQDAPATKPRHDRAPVIRHRPMKTERSSPWPLLIGVGVVVAGFLLMRLFVNLQRLAPRTEQRIGVAETTPSPAAPSVAPTAAVVQVPAKAAPKSQPPPPSVAPAASVSAPPQVASSSLVATPPPPAAGPAKEPEIRRAEPVRPEDLAKAGVTETPAATAAAAAAAAAAPAAPAASAPSADATGPNKVAIKPLRKTYIKVVVDNDAANPPFERWISPSDGVVEFHGQHIAVRVLDRDAIQIKKNGKSLTEGDSDVTVE
jgi:cytoskeletal protein RodZ